MKRVLVVFAAAIVAVALYAVAAPASEQGVTPKQFAALSKKVTSLKNEVRAFESCFKGAVPIAAFGDPNGNYGYLYDTPNGGHIYTTAIDIADTQSAQAYALVTDAQCASIFNGGKKKIDLRVHHSK